VISAGSRSFLYSLGAGCYEAAVRFLKIAFLLLGTVLLFWIIQKIGWEELLKSFQRLGWSLWLVTFLMFIPYLFFTFAWWLFLKLHDHYSISFWTLFQIKLAGEATNAMTPLNFVGGDPLRVWFLSKNYPASIGGASVVVDRTLNMLATILVILVGNLAALFQFEFSRKMYWFLVGCTVVLFLLLFLFLIFQKSGVFQKLFVLLKKIGIRHFSAVTEQKLVELDGTLKWYYQEHRRLFYGGILLHSVGRFFGVLEILLLGRFLGVPMNVSQALFFASVIPLTNVLGVFVPGTFGVLEGVVSTFFIIFHWNPADGIVLQIARRIRATFWILVGLLIVVLFKSEKNLPKENQVNQAKNRK